MNTSCHHPSEGISRGRRKLVLAAGLAPWMSQVRAQEQAWRPTRPVRLIVPFPAGGGTDQVARLFADKLQARLGQSVVVDNRGGANGIVGTQLANAAPPDGLTLLIGTIDTHATNASLYANLPYDPEAFVPVSAVATLPMVLAVSKQGRARTMRELTAVAATGQGNYGHWAVGSLGHLASELFKQQANMPTLQGIPYQGTGPGMQALIAGQIDVMYMPLALARANAERLSILGVASPQRFPSAKDIPTMAEVGYPLDADGWIGLFAPPKLPPAIAQSLHKIASETIADPELNKRMLDMGVAPQRFESINAYGQWISAERARWGKVIKGLGIKLTA
jgi:tripartite-type tricarboxylate transporter receptor subunit TctC